MNKIEKAVHKLAVVLNGIGAAGVFAVMILVVLNVILRKLFNAPIAGTYEGVIYGMLTVVCLGLIYNELRDGNISISFFLEKMRPKTANVIRIITTAISTVLMGSITVNQYSMIIAKYNNHAVSDVLNIPHWIIVLILTLGFAALTLVLLLKTVLLVMNHKSLPDHIMTAEERAEQLEVDETGM